MKKEFDTKELRDMGLPHDAPDGGSIVSNRIIGHSRWSVEHEVIFKMPGMSANEAWSATYSVGATESQDERPWQDDDTVLCTLVREVEKTVKVWEPA